MNIRNALIGFTTGALAAYAAVRTIEALQPPPAAAEPGDARAYGRLRRRLAVASTIRSTAGALAFAYGPLAARTADGVGHLPAWLRPGALAALASIGGSLVELPVSFAESYAIERRFGLTEQTPRAWLLDAAKATALSVALASLLATLAGSALRAFPRRWWIAGTLGAFPLYLLANIIGPVFIMPLFNRFEPLRGELETDLRGLATRLGVDDPEILTMDMSRQTRKANAFVTGIGTTHRIVLGDTLVEHFEPAEIAFVIAHELGHYVSRDTWRLIALAEGATALLLATIAAVDRANDDRPELRVVRIAALLGVGTLVLQPLLAAFSRSREWAADRFALAATADPASGIGAFTRLRDQNLAEDEVPEWYEFFFGSHPSLGKRIAALAAEGA